MKQIYRYLFLAVFLLIIIGIIFSIPRAILFPVIQYRPVTSGEYASFIVSIVSAIITFLAVIVALFKDDLREYWKRPRIQFGTPEKFTIEELSENESHNGAGTLIEAQKYLSRIEVKNTGNVPAFNVELYLEKLEFQEKNSQILENIETASTPITWSGTNKDSIVIPPGSKKLINVVEIYAPQKMSLPDSTKTNEPIKLVIGNIENPNHDAKGTWLATFGAYAQNHKPITFQIRFEWKGVWKSRLTEMEKQYKIEILN